MKVIKSALFSLFCAAASVYGQIQTEDLLLNVDASSLSSLSDGAIINSWTNTGTLGGEFVPAVGGQGAVYQTNVLGVAAVTFDGSANTMMDSAITPPESILSNNTWSVELWVLNTTLSYPEDQLAWTDRGNWPASGATGTCMEFRYCSDANNCVEHYSTPNIPWSGPPAQAGTWHHLAITREADGTERLYANGVLRTTKVAALNLRAGSSFKLGGVYDLAASGWVFGFSGSLAKVRVHDGTLSGAQVVNNYLYERNEFQPVWDGTAGSSLPWNDPANWLNGNVATNGDSVWIDNGGTAVLTNDLDILSLYSYDGGLTISNGAAMTVTPANNTYVGSGGGSGFDLTITDGSLSIIGSNARSLYLGDSGGSADVVIGGGSNPASLSVDRYVFAADGNGCSANIEVAENGSITTDYADFYLAGGIGAAGSLTMSGGTVGATQTGRSFFVNNNGAHGTVVVNSGSVEPTSDMIWSAGTVTDAASGIVYLNGGSLQARRFYGSNTSGTNLLYLNGGTIKARESRTDFMYNLTAAYVQSGGVNFDIGTGLDNTAGQALIEDPLSTGGGITKTGAGSLTLNGVNTFTGPIAVNGGALYFSNTNGLPVGYTSSISVANDGAIGYAKVGGPAEILVNLNKSSLGYLTLFENNSDDAVDFSTFPNMKLLLENVTDYIGDYTPYQGQYEYLVDGTVVDNSSVLTNASGFTGHLSIIGVNGGGMVLSGNNSFSGGVEIDGAAVTMADANALGVQGTPGVADVELLNGSVLSLDAAMDVNAFVTNRLKTSSSGILLIGAANADQDVDLTGLPGIVIGSAELTLNYSGTITPDATTYRLGGGSTVYASPNHGLSVSNLTDNGAATEVVIGTPGIVELKSGNTYSGGTVVTNGGILFIEEDGLGAVPGSPDANNLYINGGVLRSGQDNFTLHANRGLSVGPDGMVMHPWGGSNMELAGDLSGSGDISVTDSGSVTFAGTANTYDGAVTINSSLNIRIGNGSSFSWGSTGGITDNGSLFLKTDNTSTFSDSVSGSGVLRKEGSGTLTIDAQQSYTGITYVDEGVLNVSATDTLPSGAVVEIASGAEFDVDGLDLSVGSLQGAGEVIDSDGSSTNFTVGAQDKSGVFDGSVTASLALLKTGAGTQSLTSTNGAANNAEVQQGTLKLLDGGSITGAVSVAAGGTLAVESGEIGLVGEFYNLSTAPTSANIASLSAAETLLAGETPDLVINSTDVSDYLNLGHTGAYPPNNFPGTYAQYSASNFLVWFKGAFYASVAGTYGFATVSDDGSMVFIDGAVAVDNNGNQSYTPSDMNTIGNVVLTKGYHQIDVLMYEVGGDQGLSVYMTPPGGSQALLPNTLLATSDSFGLESSVGSLEGAEGSTLFLADVGEPVLHITGDDNMTFDGNIIASNSASRLVKDGSGILTLTSGTSDQSGILAIQAGTLSLPGRAGILGTLKMANGVTTDVSGMQGLVMEFYNRSSADSDYSEFQSLAAWENYLTSTFPSGPDYITNSLVLGDNLDTGEGGTEWPYPYAYGQSEGDTYDTYFYGSIYLSDSGTYTFQTRSDDGSMLFIDGQLVVDNDGNHGMVTVTDSVDLNAGFHDIAILFRENTGGNAIRVYIAYPGEESTSLMPQSILFGGAALRGLAGDAGSTLDLGSDGSVLLLQDDNTTHAGDIDGDSGTVVQKNGTGTLTLTGDNTGFDGTYTILEGALSVGDGGATGALGATAGASVGEDGTLIFDRTGTVTVGGALSGTGLIQLNGPGEVYLTANSDFEGLVEVNNGRLTFAPGISLCTDGVISNDAVVEAETSGAIFWLDTLNGDGDFEVTGDGTLKLRDDTDSFTGDTLIESNATLQVSAAGQLGGGGDMVLDGTLSIVPDVVAGTNILVSALAVTNDWTLNGSATWVTRYDTNWVQVTPNSGSQAGSAFNNIKITPEEPWYASFRYEVGDTSSNPADGMSFVLQNDTDGANALGSSGGQLGVNTISPSIGIFFNLYNTDSIGWIVDGSKVDATTSISGIDLVAGVDVELSFNGEKLVLTVTQGQNEFSAERTIDLSTAFSGNTTWVGFTGGTGGATAQQFVGNFVMACAATASTDFANTLVVESDTDGDLSVLVVNDDAEMNFAGLELGSAATLDVSAASGSKTDADYLVSVSNLTVAAGTGTVNMATNGTGTGALGLENLVIGSGSLLTVTGGVSAPAGSLTVTVPTPVPSGVTLLGDFTAATWVGAQPDLYLVDENGDPVDAVLKLRNGQLYINTVTGTCIIIR